MVMPMVEMVSRYGNLPHRNKSFEHVALSAFYHSEASGQTRRSQRQKIQQKYPPSGRTNTSPRLCRSCFSFHIDIPSYKDTMKSTTLFMFLCLIVGAICQDHQPTTTTIQTRKVRKCMPVLCFALYFA